MKMKTRNFRIGELAEHLGLEKFVIRFWEKEFNIKGQRSDGGQRFYQDKDIKKFEAIKVLLYEKGFTIAGAKKYIKDNPKKTDKTILASQVTTMDAQNTQPTQEPTPKQEFSSKPSDVAQQILALQEKLMKLKELL